MIFNEIYNIYYRMISLALDFAQKGQLTDSSLRELARTDGFEESYLGVLSALEENRWPILAAEKSSYTTRLTNTAVRPDSILEKRFIKTILQDKRISLFLSDELQLKFHNQLESVEPLWNEDDIILFDQYSGGDDYGSPQYIENFRAILNAARRQRRVFISYRLKTGETRQYNFVPAKIEYSEKDDKFRVLGKTHKGWLTLRFSSIEKVLSSDKVRLEGIDLTPPAQVSDRSVVVNVANERNALERFLFTFSHYYKETTALGKEKDGIFHYSVTLHYNKDDETELLIRLLSFGPMLQVERPDTFVELIRERLRKQAAYTATCS